jgi:threonine-phosphate decarboxylase
MIAHGGDVWQVAKEFGIPVEEILDFSANINPRGLPERARERLERDAADSHLLSLYPDPTARKLREALSVKLDVPHESIVVGPGAEALLSPILRAIGARRAFVPVPAFSEYGRVCEQLSIERMDESEPCDVVFLNNPHNPSGALVEACEVRRTFETARSKGTALLVDEAFIDYAPGASVVTDAARETGLIVLRSLTKFYGCPALRVGYAVAKPETARRISSLLPMWPVTQLALDALTEAVADDEYGEVSRRENEIERERLAHGLRESGLTVFPSAANFLLLELKAEMPSSAELRSRLIQKHRILIRNCDSYEGLAKGRFVRVAVRSAAENGRLIEALTIEVLR